MNKEYLVKNLLECSQAEIQELNQLLGGKVSLQTNDAEEGDGEPDGDEGDGTGGNGNDTHPIPPPHG